jgi:hypothetical protein
MCRTAHTSALRIVQILFRLQIQDVAGIITIGREVYIFELLVVR